GGGPAPLPATPGNAETGGAAPGGAGRGIPWFSSRVVDIAGGGYTLQVPGGGLAGATSSAFNVVPAAAAQLVITVQPPAQVTAGDPFGITVAAVDPYGNLATSFSGGVTIALGSHSANGVLTVTATAKESRGRAAHSCVS